MVEDCNYTRKRVRDDSDESDENLPESKVSRVESSSDLNSSESSDDSEENELAESGLVDSDSAPLDSPAAREIQDDLFNILDESDNVVERDSSMQGLDSVIKSFEEEILASGQDAVEPNPVPESCDLRHLLEASDDELGLPPTVMPSSKEDKPETEGFNRVGPDGMDLSRFMGFEDDMQQYEALGYETGVYVGYGVAGDDDDNGGGFVTLDGLFDYTEPGDMLWRSESLQAM